MRFLCKIITLVFIFLYSTCYAKDSVKPVDGSVFLPLRANINDINIKGVVVEFLDKSDDYYGKVVSYTSWRDIFTSIRDQGGAGISPLLSEHPLKMYADAGKDAMHELQERYHDAALDAALKQKASMAMWGVIDSYENKVIIWPYLTILRDDNFKKLAVNVELSKNNNIAINSNIYRDKFNFSPIVLPRDRLLSRRYVVRYDGTYLHASADTASAKLKLMEKGDVIEVIDMIDEWLVVEVNNNKAYTKVWNYDIFPGYVFAQSGLVWGVDAPSSNAKRLVLLSKDTPYNVVSMRLVGTMDNFETWYELNCGNVACWVRTSSVQSGNVIPAINFMSALYRFFGYDFQRSYLEMSAYLQQVGENEDNVNISVAHQIMGMSVLLSDNLKENDYINAYGHFTKAIDMTPYDPLPYKLRIISSLSLPNKLKHIPSDISAAYTLDVQDAHTIAFLKSINRFISEKSVESSSDYKVRYDSEFKSIQTKMIELDVFSVK